MDGVIRRFTAAGGIALVLALPASARADGGKPPNVSAVLQYVEMIPSASGVSPVGAGGGRRASSLSGRARRALKSLPDAQATALEEVATLVAAGAPASSPRPATAPPRVAKGDRSSAPSQLPDASVSAALGSVGDLTDRGGGVGLALPVALVAATLAIAGAALRRARVSG